MLYIHHRLLEIYVFTHSAENKYKDAEFVVNAENEWIQRCQQGLVHDLPDMTTTVLVHNDVVQRQWINVNQTQRGKNDVTVLSRPHNQDKTKVR